MSLHRRQVLGSAAAAVLATVGAAARGPDYGALARSVDGRVVFPGDREYAEARQLFQPRYDVVAPGAVAYPAHAGDVAVCLDFARRSAAAVVPRGGGHSYAGTATRAGPPAPPGWSSTPGPWHRWRSKGTAYGSARGRGSGMCTPPSPGAAVPSRRGCAPPSASPGSRSAGVWGWCRGRTEPPPTGSQALGWSPPTGRSARSPPIAIRSSSGPCAAVAAGTSAWSPSSASGRTRSATAPSRNSTGPAATPRTSCAAGSAGWPDCRTRSGARWSSSSKRGRGPRSGRRPRRAPGPGRPPRPLPSGWCASTAAASWNGS